MHKHKQHISSPRGKRRGLKLSNRCMHFCSHTSTLADHEFATLVERVQRLCACAMQAGNALAIYWVFQGIPSIVDSLNISLKKVMVWGGLQWMGLVVRR